MGETLFNYEQAQKGNQNNGQQSGYTLADHEEEVYRRLQAASSSQGGLQPASEEGEAPSSREESSYPRIVQGEAEVPRDHAPIGAEPSPEEMSGRADTPFNRLPAPMRASIMGGMAGYVAGKVPFVGGGVQNRVIGPAAVNYYIQDSKLPELPKDK